MSSNGWDSKRQFRLPKKSLEVKKESDYLYIIYVWCSHDIVRFKVGSEERIRLHENYLGGMLPLNFNGSQESCFSVRCL